MILDDLNVMIPPDDTWVTRLREGHFVYAPKLYQWCKVEWPYESPDPGGLAGRIGIRPCWQEHWEWGVCDIQSWFIFPDGTGFDGSTLLLPAEDNCPDDPPELPDEWRRRVERQLGYLNHMLERVLSKLCE